MENKKDLQRVPASPDGIDRRGFLKCMQWAGTGVVWSFAAGVPVSGLLGADSETSSGLLLRANQRQSHRLQQARQPRRRPERFRRPSTRSTSVEEQPDFLIHTGDLTHLARASEFDTLHQTLKSLRQRQVFYVPGEHDVTGDDGKLYLERFGKGTIGNGLAELRP